MRNLITLQDFKPYRPITENIKMEERLMPYITEAHEIDLQNLIGFEFYEDLMNNTKDYGALISGETYTINSRKKMYPGLKPFLVYSSYARFIINNPVTATPFGVVQKETDFSSPVTDKTLARLEGSAKTMANNYQSLIVSYLNDKYTDYPLWNNSCDTAKKFSKSGIKLTKIG